MTTKGGQSAAAAPFFAAATRDATGRSRLQQRSKTSTRCISTRRSAGPWAARESCSATSATETTKKKRPVWPTYRAQITGGTECYGRRYPCGDPFNLAALDVNRLTEVALR